VGSLVLPPPWTGPDLDCPTCGAVLTTVPVYAYWCPRDGIWGLIVYRGRPWLKKIDEGGLMNGYELKTKNPKHQARIGWDPALKTFFFVVFDISRENKAGYDLIWIGTQYESLTVLDYVLEIANNYGEITPDLVANLKKDHSA
jgi:hypothetical protein